MIKKEIIMPTGEKYTVGFRDFGSYNDGILCCILQKVLFFNVAIYRKIFLKSVINNYQNMAILTIENYKREQEEKIIC